MGGFVRDEKCAFPACRKTASIIYDTPVDPDMILLFCKKHIPKGKLIKEVLVKKGPLKGERFGMALMFNERGITWIKKCKKSTEFDLNIDPNSARIIKSGDYE